MKFALKLGFIILFSSLFFACNQADKENKTTKSVTDELSKEETLAKSEEIGKFAIGVFYFHGDRRCKTCVAVGKVAKETVEKHLSGVKDIIFKDINIDKAENEFLARKFKVTGSGLYITDFTGKDFQNITKFAFANALKNPELLKEHIIKCVKK